MPVDRGNRVDNDYYCNCTGGLEQVQLPDKTQVDFAEERRVAYTITVLSKRYYRVLAA